MTCSECNEGSRYRAFGNTRRSPYLACGHEGWKRGVREGFLVGMGMIRTIEVVCGGQTEGKRMSKGTGARIIGK